MPGTTKDPVDTLSCQALGIPETKQDVTVQRLSAEESQQLLHQLREQQAELEALKEELRRTKLELETSRARFFEFYNSAPFGYLALDDEGEILMANLTAATKLGVERNTLVNKRLDDFIHLDDLDIYHLHFKQLIETGEVRTWDMRMKRAEKTPFWLHLKATQTHYGEYGIAFSDITGIKQTALTLQMNTEAFANATLDGLSAHICVIDAQGLIVTTNRAWNEFAAENNAAPETCGVGASYLDVCLAENENDAEDADDFRTGIRAVLDGTKQEFIKEYTCHSPAAEHWFTCRVNQFTVAGTTYAVISHTDITWRKQAENELRESNEKLRQLSQQQTTIFDASPVGIAIVVDRKVISQNRTFCQMMGYSPEEIYSKSTRLFYLSQDAFERFGRAAYPRFVEGKIFNTETEFRRKDGSSFAVNITGGAIDPADLSIGSIWVFEDISERKFVNDRLRKLSQAVEQSPVTIVITDTQGTIEFVNPKFTHLTGYTAEEALGRNPRILQSGQTLPEVYVNLWSTIKAGNVWEGEFLNRSKDGTLFWEHATISPLRDSIGIITHFLAVKEDVTEKKSVMEQLVQSQKIESIGQLAGGLAHDFNNILSVISGYACLLKLTMGPDKKQRDNLEKIMTATSRAAELTHSLLAYSRKQIMNPQLQNLNTLIANVGSFIRRLIGENIDLAITMKNDPLSVNVDTVQIEQVMLNLATNARDAMPNGGVFGITTAAGSVENKNIASNGSGGVCQYAVITVSDTGCGIDEQQVLRIFDPFFTTKESGKGTGLGLSMVMGIIQQHGGFIDVQSEKGIGTTFSIYLPLDESEDASQETESSVLQIVTGTGTILVAEDDPVVRALMEELLTTSGYTVIPAVDGQDAVEKYSDMKDEINLVIMDMVMPRKSGKVACDEIRQINGAARILLVSGYASDVLERQGDLAADVKLIMKPIHPLKIMSTIAEILKK